MVIYLRLIDFAALVSFSTTPSVSTLFESVPPFVQDVQEQLAHLLQPASAALAAHLETATHALHESSNPLAKQLVTLLAHPYAADVSTIAWKVVLSLLVINFVVLPFNKRQTARIAARNRRNDPNMVDVGLGFGGGASGKNNGHGEVDVIWGDNTIRVPLPPPNSPLSALKDTLYNMTGVPPNHQHLISSGGSLKDDLAPISSFNLLYPPPPESEVKATTSFWDNWGLRSSAKKVPVKRLKMLGTKTVSARVDDRLSTRSDLKLAQEQEDKPPVEKPKDAEDTIVAKIAALVKTAMDEWGPKIVDLEAYLAQKLAGEKPVDPEADPAEEVVPLEKPNPKTAAWLSEVLLQSLLKLDSIEIPGTYEIARKDRKDAVRKLQACLDRVDAYTGAAAKL
ncbi:hypothetical protein RQP46_001616 [Phenoliferia psychrophenolica]